MDSPRGCGADTQSAPPRSQRAPMATPAAADSPAMTSSAGQPRRGPTAVSQGPAPRGGRAEDPRGAPPQRAGAAEPPSECAPPAPAYAAGVARPLRGRPPLVATRRGRQWPDGGRRSFSAALHSYPSGPHLYARLHAGAAQAHRAIRSVLYTQRPSTNPNSAGGGNRGHRGGIRAEANRTEAPHPIPVPPVVIYSPVVSVTGGVFGRA